MALGQNFATGILLDTATKSGIKHKRGVFTGDRNGAIASRFYFHFKLRGMRYDRVLAELNKEFYLSELRIAQLIMQSDEKINYLKAKNADIKYLANQYPHFNWRLNAV